MLGVFGKGMMVEHLKHEGTSHSSSDLLKIFVKSPDRLLQPQKYSNQWDQNKLLNLTKAARGTEWNASFIAV